MKRTVIVNINGTNYSAEVQDRMLLVQFIREVAGLTGTHVGCDTGHCGACTVIVDGKSVKSCMMLAVQANGSKVVTVEGLAKDSKLHALQEAFREEFAVQCGYCTPGMLMSSLFLLEKHPNPTDEEIKEGIAGNICRCAGYPNIVRAIKSASRKAAESPS